MQTWARRGLQTALVTGGLLMLGTGIASATENVNPDRPAGPLDPKVNIPVRVHDNAVGTPLGQLNVPNVRRDVVVSTDAVTKGLPVGKAAPVAGKAQQLAAPVAGTLPQQASRLTPQVDDLFRGNKVTGDLLVPIEIAGNAVAAGGDVHVDSTSNEDFVSHSPVVTSGSGSALAGNVVNLDWAAPIRVSGNAVGALGKATTHMVSDKTTVAGGNILTDGTDAVLSGNVVSGQLATPIQATGNAVAGGGMAESDTEMADAAGAPGTITTNGDHGVGSGTGGGAPIALPVAVHGNAVSSGGKAKTTTENVLIAGAGTALDGARTHAAPDYIKTSGTESVLSGTVAQSAWSGPADVTCNATTAVGMADCAGESANATKAGGSTSTNGDKSAGSGTQASAPVALPAEVFGNSAAGGGLTNATHDHSTAALAGGDAITSGKDAVLAGTNGNTPVAGPAEVFGNSAAGLGIAKDTAGTESVTDAGGKSKTNGSNGAGSGALANTPVALPAEVFGQAAAAGGTADAHAGEQKVSNAGGDSLTAADNAVLGGTAAHPAVSGPAQVLSNGAAVLGKVNTDVTNDVTTTSGGYTGTTGNDSAGSGNAVTGAVALPAEVLGNGANLGGLSHSTVKENKVSTAGGGTNTDDDAGVLSANAVAASLAGPVQVFGNAASGAGIATANAVKQTTATAGGPVKAKGTGGAGSGNVAAVPVALPSQVFGLAAGGLGKASAFATGDTSSTSGGDITADGKNGTFAGNVATVPGAAAAQVFGSAAGVGGLVGSSGENTTDSTAGGNVLTSGENGSAAGNVATAQALPVAQVFGLAAAGTGLVSAGALNDTVLSSGGDVTTNGDRGSVSGNLADVPATAVATVFGDAAAVGGSALGVGPNETTAITGGTDMTSGKGGSLSGNLATVPAAAVAQIFGNAASVVGSAVGIGPNQTTALAGADAFTSGEAGSISGNLLAVPLAAVAQVFGDAASLGGQGVGIAPNENTTLAGGMYGTDGSLKQLSGINKVVPVGVVAQIFAIPVPVVANALALATNNTAVMVDETAPLIDLPITTGALAANALPSLPGQNRLVSGNLLRGKGTSRSDLPVGTPGVSDVSIAGLPGGSPELPGLNVVPNFGGTNVDGVELPNLPLGSDGRLPSVDSVQQGSALSALDSTDFLADTVPTLNALKLLSIDPQLG